MAENGRYVEGSIWFFAPNKGAPVFFAVAFLASGIVHTWQNTRYKSWKLAGLFVLCAALFVAGFIVREVGAFNFGNLDVYIASICLVYAAPPLYELCNYQILGRILYYTPHLAPIHPGRVLTTFAAISAVVEALSGNGASLSSNQSAPQQTQDTGHALLKAALLMQIFVIVAFMTLAGVFHVRCKRAGIQSAKLYGPLTTLYISTGLVTVRTIYRIVEYFSIAELHYGPGLDPMSLSPLIRYEWFFYVFEATLMLCNTVLWNVRHPRRYLPASTKIYLDKDNVTEITGPGYKDSRNFLATLFDPFDIYGLIKGRDRETAFWENNRTEGPETKDGPKKDESKTVAEQDAARVV